MCPLMFFAPRLPRITRGGRAGDALAGAAGGMMGGIGGFAGVVPTLWVQLRGLPKEQARAVIQNFNLSVLLMAFAGYLLAGLATREMLPLFAIVAPAMLIPSLLGARLYAGISESGFRKVLLGLLTASGVALLVASVPLLVKRL
jgi:uncharacterized membrane protein YfcA